MPATARAPWHKPEIAEHIILTPPAAQLTLSSRHPKRERTDHEHEAELNRNRQDRWRERDAMQLSCGGTVTWSGDVLTMLVGMGQIQDNETDNPKIVSQAIPGLHNLRGRGRSNTIGWA
jgi:hypothetical protein